MNLNDWPSEPRWDDTVCSEENYDAFFIGVDAKITTTSTGVFGPPPTTTTPTKTTATIAPTLTSGGGVPTATKPSDIAGLRDYLASQKTASPTPIPQTRMAKPTEPTVISGGGGGGEELPTEEKAQVPLAAKKNYNIILIAAAVAAVLFVSTK